LGNDGENHVKRVFFGVFEEVVAIGDQAEDPLKSTELEERKKTQRKRRGLTRSAFASDLRLVGLPPAAAGRARGRGFTASQRHSFTALRPRQSPAAAAPSLPVCLFRLQRPRPGRPCRGLRGRTDGRTDVCTVLPCSKYSTNQTSLLCRRTGGRSDAAVEAHVVFGFAGEREKERDPMH